MRGGSLRTSRKELGSRGGFAALAARVSFYFRRAHHTESPVDIIKARAADSVERVRQAALHTFADAFVLRMKGDGGSSLLPLRSHPMRSSDVAPRTDRLVPCRSG